MLKVNGWTITKETEELINAMSSPSLTEAMEIGNGLEIYDALDNTVEALGDGRYGWCHSVAPEALIMDLTTMDQDEADELTHKVEECIVATHRAGDMDEAYWIVDTIALADRLN